MKELNQINVTIEKMDENSMFNTTKMIKHFYESKIKIPETIISQINFLEYSNINLLIKYNKESIEHTIKESLCLNLIKHLPLDYYKEYVDLNWIFASNNYNYELIPHALAHGKTEFIEHIFELFQQKKSLKLNDKQLDNTLKNYHKLFLDHLINSSWYMKNYYFHFKDKKQSPDFKALFDLALKEYQPHLDMLKFHSSTNLKNWFSDAKEIKASISSFNTQEEYLNLILTVPQAFSFFEDALSQYSNDENPIISYHNAEIAFQSLNKEVFDVLVNKLSLNENDFYLFFQRSIQKFLNLDLKKFSERNFTDKSYESFIYDLFVFSTSYIDDFSFLDMADVSLLLTLDTPSIFQKVIQSIPHINEQPILNGLTISELIYSHQILSQFITYNEYKKKNLNICYPNLELYLGFNLSKQFPDLINVKISEERMMVVHEFLLSHLSTFVNDNLSVNISEEDLNTQFRYFSLNISLSQSDDTKKHKKLKV